jgi:hypothetical protein
MPRGWRRLALSARIHFIKMTDKGNAAWATTKTILGWVVNTLERTITLPAHRIMRLHKVADSIMPIQYRVSLLKRQ